MHYPRLRGVGADIKVFKRAFKISQTNPMKQHFSTRVREHLSSDKSSHIFKHLQSSERCRQSCSADCFEILDSAPTKFQLKFKEAMHINWEKPNLNQQVHHVNLTLTL